MKILRNSLVTASILSLFMITTPAFAAPEQSTASLNKIVAEPSISSLEKEAENNPAVMEALRASGISKKYPNDGLARVPMAAANRDGCSWPASPVYYRVNFHYSCVAHDQCYRSSRSRLSCDQSFRASLQRDCRKVYGYYADKNGCIAVTNIYYNAVRMYGKSHYAGSGNRN